MLAIRTEHETQDRTLIAQKTRLDILGSDLSELRLMGKPEVTDISEPEAPPHVTPAPDLQIQVSQSGDVEMDDVRDRAESGELKEREVETDEEDIPLAKTLNPGARPFVPHTRSGGSLSSLPPQSKATTPAPVEESSSKEEGEEDEDVEMGELSEDGHGKGEPKMKAREDLEEGEASDLSSELSEPPED